MTRLPRSRRRLCSLDPDQPGPGLSLELRNLTHQLVALVLELGKLFFELGDGLGLPAGAEFLSLAWLPSSLSSLIVASSTSRVKPAKPRWSRPSRASSTGQGLLQLELANRHPGLCSHRAIRIVAKLDERILKVGIILGQPAEGADGRRPQRWRLTVLGVKSGQLAGLGSGCGQRELERVDSDRVVARR